MNPYQGLKRFSLGVMPIPRCCSNQHESLSGIETSTSLLGACIAARSNQHESLSGIETQQVQRRRLVQWLF